MSKIRSLHVTHRYRSEPEAVFAALASAEGLSRIFGSPMKQIEVGADGADGVGARRKVLGGPLAFVEITLVHEPFTRIEYTSEGGPLRDHRGIQVLTPTPDGGTELSYTLRFSSKIPGFAPVFEKFAERTLKRGLPKLID